MGSVSYLDSQYAHPLISERSIDEPRPLKVIYLGAGVSGIVAAIKFPEFVPNIDLTIYKKNADVGGSRTDTRDVLLVCMQPCCIHLQSVDVPLTDIPAHSYQLSFESSLSWTQFYASAPEILKYWQRVADKYDVRKYMKFRHKCVEARWDEPTSKWHVRIEQLDTRMIIEDTADVFVTGIGALNEWKWPDIKGLKDFKGVICATGFDTSFQGRFPIYGRDGRNTQDLYRSRPATYLSVCASGFPNFFQSLGPNAGLGNGNLLIIIESITLYVGQCLQKLATQNVRTLEPKQKCVDAFTSYCEAFFKRTVFSAECGSWYKSSPPGTSPEERRKGRVTALWPGSSMHAVKALEKVRFEDFEMEYVEKNEFAWFGDGWTVAERTGHVEGLTYYLNGTKFTHEDLEGQRKMVNGEKKENEVVKEEVVKVQKGDILSV